VGGVFTAMARRLMRTLAKLGGPTYLVGLTIHACSEAFGAPQRQVPSGATVWRAIVEGGLASQAQLTQELRNLTGTLGAPEKYCQITKWIKLS
jgi:hypothetical protein